MVSLFQWLLVAGLGRVASGEVAVAAYLPEWRYDGANWEEISKHVSHLILFSLEPAADGAIAALERLPRPALLKRARRATKAEGTKLLLCFGGNGRSAGFSAMTRHADARLIFLQNLVALLDKWDLDGVDYNWEYPGYRFGRGYGSDVEVDADYEGLAALVHETRQAFSGTTREITLSYYPDGRQEQLLKRHKIDEFADLMHSMTYDQGGAQHSSMALAEGAVQLRAGHGRFNVASTWMFTKQLLRGTHPRFE